jgi:hypothetical protein
MTPLKEGWFSKLSARKWDKVVKIELNLFSIRRENAENTIQVGRKSTGFLKNEYFQWSHP